MCAMKMSIIVLSCLAAFAAPLAAGAAESSSELALTGLVLAKPADTIVIDSETVSIGPEWIAISYRLINQGSAPATVTLSIPLPELDFSDPDVSWAIPGSDPINFMGLSAKIENKPGQFVVSAALRQNNLALIPVGAFENQMSALAPDLRARLSQLGLVAEVGNDVQGNPLYFPTWTVQTTANRQFTFEPNQAIQLDVRYRTSVGTSPDTFLRRPLRGEAGLASQVQRYRTNYCIDDAFYTGLDKISVAAESNNSKLRERRIFYRLTAGLPAHPIKEFRLVVDKGRPDWIVSFCGDNLKRTSPTTFEMHATEFMPNQDLRILMVGRN
jgi:hypothetical protein